MIRRFYRKMSLLMVMLMMFQILSPSVSALAATNDTMLPPSNVTVQYLTPDDIKLSWSSVFGATGYNVYGIIDGQILPVGTTKTNSFSVNDLSEGAYRYVVTTLNGTDESGPGVPVDVNITYPDMVTPATLTKSIQNGNDIVLSWTASQYAEAYKVYEITADGQNKLVGTATTTTYKLVNVPEGNYKYAVTSVNSKYGESPLSTPVQAQVIFPVMTAPSSFTFSVTTANDVTLRWGAASYATGYKIYQVINGEKTLKSTTAGTSITYTNVPAGDYTYEIHSYSDRFGESVDSKTITMSVGSVTMVPPSNFTYKVQNVNDIVLTWGAVTNANSYKIYQIVDGQKVLKSTVTGTTVTFTNMPAGDYTYEINSYSDRFGESADGSQVSLTIDAVTMVPPTNLTNRLQNGNDIVLTWDAALNANTYKVYQIVNGQKVLKNTVTTPTVTFTNMPAGDYTYEVHAYSTKFGESLDGSQTSLTLVYPTMTPPLNVVQKIKSATEFSLSWDAALYASSYKVYQIVNGQKVLKSTVSTNTVTFTSMAPGDYTFEVHTYSTRFGESVEGTTLQMTLNGQTMQEPINPTYTVTNGNDITLRWTGVPYATGYKVYQMINGEKILRTTVSTTSIFYSNMPGGDYNYIIHSYSTLLGESPNGVEVNFSLVLPTMAAPASLTSKVQNGNDVALTWTSVPYATSYKVYELVDGQEILKANVGYLTTTISNVPSGNHTYIVRSYSTRFGESAEGTQVSANLDYITMLPPTNLKSTISNGNDIVLTWTGSTYANSYKVYQVVAGVKVLKSTVTGTAVSFTNMPAGDYSYEVYSNSTRFGDSLEGTPISLTLAPITMLAPTNATSSISNGNDILLRWNSSTYATGYKVYQMVNGEKVLKLTVAGTSASFSNMPEGAYEYVVHSYSTRFGESPEGSNISFQLVWPVVQAPVVKGDVFNANNITLTWPAVTWANEYRIYEVKDGARQLVYKGNVLTYKIYNLTEDVHTYEVTAYNTRFGESAASNQIVENIIYPIMQAPAATLTLLSQTSARITWNFVVYANGYNIYEIVNGQPVPVVKNVNNLSYTVSNLSYKDHEYYVTSYSNSFGESEASNKVIAKLIVDTEAPVTTANAPSTWTNQATVNVALSATDNETGVANTYYALNGSSFVTGNNVQVNNGGVSTINFYSVDKVGNTEVAKTAYVKIDTTAPVTTANQIPVWSKEPVTVELGASDDLSGVAKTLYAIDNGGYQEGTKFIIPEGTHKVSYYSVDVAGNVEAAKTVEVKIDKTAPVTTNSNIPNWSVDPVTVQLKATDDLSGVAKTVYAIDGSEYMEGTNFTIAEEGIHKVTYYSVDVAGNVEAAKTVEVKIDKTAPVTVASQVPVWTNEAVTVELKAVDDLSGVAKTVYAIDGSAYVEGTKVEITEEGVHKVTYYSVDIAGNEEVAKTLYVKVDKTAPVTKVSEVPEWSTQPVSVKLTPTDALSGVTKTLYSINGSGYTEGTNFTISEEGIHKVNYYSVDAAGNVEKVQTIYVKIDKTAPVVMMDLKGEYQLGTLLPLTYLAQDNLSGVVAEKMVVTGPNDVIGQEVKNGAGYLIDKPGIYNVAVTVTDAAGLSTTLYKKFGVYIQANIEVTPKVIKGNSGVFTVRVNLPQGYSTQGFDLDTATLNGVKALNSNNGYYNQAKLGQFKFERAQFNWVPSEMTVNFRGYVDGHLVIGQTVVQVQK